MKRVNRNGIPLLDDSKQANQLRRRRGCLPGEHKWREEEFDSNEFGPFVRMYCVYCNEKDTKYL